MNTKDLMRNAAKIPSGQKLAHTGPPPSGGPSFHSPRNAMKSFAADSPTMQQSRPPQPSYIQTNAPIGNSMKPMMTMNKPRGVLDIIYDIIESILIFISTNKRDFNILTTKDLQAFVLLF